MAEEPQAYFAKFFTPFDFTALIGMSRSFTETAKQSSKLTTTLQALGKEWTDFVGARLREDTQLYQTLLACKELPTMQRAYMDFCQKALSQYEEEGQRLMRITREAVEEAVHAAQERAKSSSGNGSDATSSSRPTIVSADKS